MRFSVGNLNLEIDLEAGTIDVRSSIFQGASLTSQISALCLSNGHSIELTSQPWTIIHVNMDQLSTPVSSLVGAAIKLETKLSDVTLTLRIGLSQDIGMGFIQLELNNHGKTPLTIDNLTLLDIHSGNLHLGEKRISEPVFFSNGWQSWSTTRSYRQGEKQRTSILGPFQEPMVINPGTPSPKKKDHFTSDMFSVIGDRSNKVGLLAGFLSQKEHFGSLEARFDPAPSLKMCANGDHAILKPGGRMQTDWAAIQFIDIDAPEPLATYLETVALTHKIGPFPETPLGWCSWYHYYENITHDIIQSNLESVVAQSEELPLKLLQIDDGFETRAGDWFSFKTGFPNGLTPIVNQIKSSRMTPGLWLAPFIVHRKAALVKEHPEWLLRNRKGNPVTAGFVWNNFTYALDLTNPDALEYACSVVKTAVEQWGFPYLKLDFLYAAALDGNYQDPTRTRAQVLRMGLEALRDAAGTEVTLLACGCPLGSALGLFEAMRIGADVSGSWEPHFPPVSSLLHNEPHMPSARNSLQNIITRAPMHLHWWINDPDCLLVRDDTDLTLPEVQTLTSAIGLTGGSLLLSDDFPALSKDRKQLAQVLIPLIGQRAHVMDLFDVQTPSRLRVDMSGPAGDWHILAFFNWGDSPASLRFTPQQFKLKSNLNWWLREFWTGTVGQMDEHKPFTCNNVPTHGVRVVAARPVITGQPIYLGSDIHLSQGLEINDWGVKDDEVTIGFSLGRQARGKVDLYLPWHPENPTALKKSILLKEKGSGIYSIDLEFVNTLEIRIKRKTEEQLTLKT